MEFYTELRISSEMNASPRGTLYISGTTLEADSVVRVIPLEHPEEAATFSLPHREGGKYALLGGKDSLTSLHKPLVFVQTCSA